MATKAAPGFTIVGSGLAGALMACYLGRMGYPVDLYEKRSDPRGQAAQHGRSINLAISVRGIHALRAIGLAEEVLRQAIPMHGRMMHAPSGTLSFQRYGKDDSESIHSISRAGLNFALVEAAARFDTTRLFFDQKCVGCDPRAGALDFRDEITGAEVQRKADRIIGADGAYSAVRASLQKLERFDFSQSYLSHGYKELTMLAAADGGFAMEPNALHIWPRHSFMMIALPNADRSFTCTLFLPHEGGSNSFAELQSDATVRRWFHEQFPDAEPLMPDFAEDFTKNATGSMVTIQCHPWHYQDRIVLIGDAAHAVVPFLGQGMNAAFEDCTVLSECIRRRNREGLPIDWGSVFREFEDRRRVHTDALARLCVDNFMEMRDKVSSRAFLLHKKVDNALHRLLPRWYLPLYTLVTFSRTPYADAVRRVRIQQLCVRVVSGAIALLIALLLFLLLSR